MSGTHEDIGGDPVCWLNRVCENCGRFIGDEFAEVCEHCGAARYDDEPGAGSAALLPPATPGSSRE